MPYIIFYYIYIATTTVLETFTNSTGKQLCWSLFFFLEMMKLYKDICSAWIKVDLHSENVSCANDAICWQMFFFQSTFEANKIFFLLNKLVIFTKQKPALKITTVQQSLAIVKTFVTTEKPCWTVTMTATT